MIVDLLIHIQSPKSSYFECIWLSSKYFMIASCTTTTKTGFFCQSHLVRHVNKQSIEQNRLSPSTLDCPPEELSIWGKGHRAVPERVVRPGSGKARQANIIKYPIDICKNMRIYIYTNIKYWVFGPTKSCLTNFGMFLRYKGQVGKGEFASAKSES